jgi:hypothetical protein
MKRASSWAFSLCLVSMSGCVPNSQFKPGPQLNLDLPTGSGPTGLAVADLTGDGKPDIVTANSSAATVSLLVNQGQRPFGSVTFATKQDFAVAAGPVAVAIADLDGDGKPDVAVACASADVVTILSGTASPALGARTDVPVAKTPSSIAIGDLNKDGRPDIVVAAQGANVVTVLLAQPNGGYARTDIPVGAIPRGVALLDANGDGKLDIVTANQGSSTITLLLGDGTGAFPTRRDFAVGPGPVALRVADVNGDGHPDVVTANAGNDTVSVMLGDGLGSFASKGDQSTGLLAISDVVVAHAGFPGSEQDLIVTGAGSDSLGIYFGDGTGAFTLHPASFATLRGPAGVAAADVDGNGIMDFVVTCSQDDVVRVILGPG